MQSVVRSNANGWSSGVQFRTAFQLVFQLKIKTDINTINQCLAEPIQITPANLDTREARPVRIFLHLDA